MNTHNITKGLGLLGMGLALAVPFAPSLTSSQALITSVIATLFGTLMFVIGGHLD